MNTKEIQFGEHLLRIQETKDGFVGIVVGDSANKLQASTEGELISALQTKVRKNHSNFIGYSGARERFLQLFADGFSDAKYIGDKYSKTGERFYKWQMVERVNAEFPIEGWRELEQPGETSLRLFRGINLIDPYTKTDLARVLRGENAVDLLEICTEFAQENIASACGKLSAKFKSKNLAKWPVITFLPFFWKPNNHFFLKPDFTKKFAERVGHKFQYEYDSTPNPDTYYSLLSMVDETKEMIADLAPKSGLDNIDIHSFMWSVMNYDDSH